MSTGAPSDVAVAFRDADGPMRAALVHCLDFMNGLPFFRAYKAHTWETLGVGTGGSFLDVACGVGFDVLEMAAAHPQTHFTGADRSAAFLDIARSRAARLQNARFIEADAARLPFPDAAFDGARIDRSLQHIADPAAAVREMARVTRPGGRVVAAEPDWGAFFLYDGETDVGRRMAAKWLESFAHPYIGRELGLLFAGAGLADIGCAAHALALTQLAEADVVFDLPRLLQNCVAAGVLSAGEARDWRAAAGAASARGAFLACLTIVERWGTVAP